MTLDRRNLLALLALSTLAVSACSGGSTVDCTPACPTGFTCTETGCVADNPSDKDMSTSAVDMPGGNACGVTCGGATPYCNTQTKICVPCLEDSHCPKGQLCKPTGNSASCIPGCADDSRCPDGTHCCAGACIDTTKDVNNCGGCGTVCGSQHSSTKCDAGKCVPGACNNGWGDCNADPKDGCETNLLADPKNCTACGMTCSIKNAIAGCSGVDMPACYIAACQFGWDDCNSDPKDGCETSVLSDTKNCGGCGMPCANIPNAQSACVNAACALKACNAGFTDCNGIAKDGCEVNTGTDAKNCGACGNVCAQGLVCINSACTCPMCNIPNSKTKCVNNQCVFDQCLPGYGDCNNNVADGCEVNLAVDKNNCASCGNVCPQNMQYCWQSACTPNLPGVLLGSIAGQEYYKVQVMGTMSDNNIITACMQAGMKVPCQGPNGCMYNNNQMACVMTQEKSCGNPMQTLSQTICNGVNPPQCKALDNCFQFMGNVWQNGSSCGVLNGVWCTVGNNAKDGFAICTP